MSDTAIKIVGLKKQYRLGAINRATLREELQSRRAIRRGQEDPNAEMGQTVTGRKVFNALNGIDLEIKKGETVGIIGGNGAGKSTLLKILSRITAPTEGEAWIDGRISSMLEVGAGFHAELTGRENIYMDGAILGMTRKEVESKMDSIIEFSECKEFIDTPAKRYSSGMYVKMAFAVSAHLDADILIMDEVLAVGDMKFQKKCLTKMRELAENEGKTVLYVSHNMATIRELCKRCVVLDKGKIIFDGDTEQAIEVYLGAVKGELITNIDFTESARPENHGKKIFISSLQFLDKERAMYTSGETIRFAVRWQAREELKDIRIGFAVERADGNAVGMAYSEPVLTSKTGETHTTEFEFDPGNLIAGLYTCHILAFETNEYGAMAIYDKPDLKIDFELFGLEKTDVKWRYQSMGSTRLNSFKLMGQD